MHPAGRLIALCLLPAALLGACAQSGATALSGARIPASGYAGAFQAARETLRDYRFELDRVDAPQGVLTSVPRASPGLAKPWEVESSSAALDDLLSFQQRTVQVAFVPGEPQARTAGAPILPPTDPDRDLVSSPADTTLLVRVTVQRVERPQRRVSMDTVRIIRQAGDPAAAEQGAFPSYLVTQPDDDEFAARLLRAILARTQPITPPAPPAPRAPAQPSAQP